MRVKRIFNRELLMSVLGKPDLWKVMNEDGVGSPEEYRPSMGRLSAIALLGDEDALHGFLVGTHRTQTVMDVHVAIDPAFWGAKANVALGRAGCKELFDLHPRVHKLVAAIPVTDKQVLRYAQRVGFQREGINRASFLRNGELLDQTYVGLQRPR